GGETAAQEPATAGYLHTSTPLLGRARNELESRPMSRIEIAPSHGPAFDPLDTETVSARRRLERRLHRSMYLGAQHVRGRPIGKLMRQLAEWDSLDAKSYAALSRARLEQMRSFAAERVPLYRS